MSFSSEWLALREPADLDARNRVLLAHVAAMLVGTNAPTVTDLGAGTGSTVRALAPHLPERTGWRLVDADASLLARASWELPEDRVETRVLDLAAELDTALDGAVDLVSCSALLDLVSLDWMAGLAQALKARELPFYAALTYDGRADLTSRHPLDAALIDTVNQHQHTDKGFGPALGPDGAAAAIEQLEAAGFSVESGRSDWVLEPDEAALQKALVTGWAEAAAELGTLSPTDIEEWRAARFAAIEAGTLEIRVGHVDVFARP